MLLAELVGTHDEVGTTRDVCDEGRLRREEETTRSGRRKVVGRGGGWRTKEREHDGRHDEGGAYRASQRRLKYTTRQTADDRRRATDETGGRGRRERAYEPAGRTYGTGGRTDGQRHVCVRRGRLRDSQPPRGGGGGSSSTSTSGTMWHDAMGCVVWCGVMQLLHLNLSANALSSDDVALLAVALRKVWLKGPLVRAMGHMSVAAHGSLSTLLLLHSSQRNRNLDARADLPSLLLHSSPEGRGPTRARISRRFFAATGPNVATQADRADKQVDRVMSKGYIAANGGATMSRDWTPAMNQGLVDLDHLQSDAMYGPITLDLSDRARAGVPLTQAVKAFCVGPSALGNARVSSRMCIAIGKLMTSRCASNPWSLPA